ncbi:molybdopterin-dependent oxidoreductase [Gordonibacter sp.]|uniref:molybdopterin-containing oxidoreductase family protein n=1 Tax=Gordonibacter sp. TaxID=1968902 RepID=UPI001F9B7818|nr:molybdopterin-dependent oxidoreductase [Gordonibacter sp.]HIW75789.1 molybdopterin-dependent oxidoreductase [Candidatus Gordonibacter avicola]
MSENENFVYTACQGWGCHEHCVLKTYVKDGVIERTERAILKGPRAERHRVCQKGMVVGKLPYIKERILHPLKRTGERGEGKFEQISWDQAIEEITEKMQDSIEKYGPETVMVNTFCCGIVGGVGALETALTLRLIFTSGATRFHFPIIDVAGQWEYNIEDGDGGFTIMSDTDALADAKYLITWGGNPVGWTRAAHTTRTIIDAQEKGMKLVHIGLVYDCTAAKADQFIPINAATDAALALAMAKIVIDEDRVDEDALLKYTCAPLLIRDDNGQYLREADIKEGGDPKTLLCWDKTTNGPAPIGPAESIDRDLEDRTFSSFANYRTNTTVSAEDLDPELDKIVEINGIACKTAFAKLKEHLEPWTPEKQESITGVPAQVAIDLVHEYMDADPGCIYLNDGLRYSNGGQAYRAINLLPILTGNFAKRGGRITISPLGDGETVYLNDTEMTMPDGYENMKGNQVSFDEILESFDHPERQQYRVYLNTYVNPVHAWPNPKVVCDQFLKRLDLMIDIDFRMTDSTAWADYVLPVCTPFEREEILATANTMTLLEAAIEPMGESKPPSFIYSIFAKAMGVGDYFEGMEDADWHRLRLSGGDPKLGGPEPITYERLKEEKTIPLYGAVDDTDVYARKAWKFDTVSGRYEFYCEDLAGAGGGFGTYEEPRLHDPEKLADYPLQMYPGRHRVFMQTQFTEFPELTAIGGDKPRVSLNPATAKERGIKEGDLIEVYNYQGKMTSVATLSEAFPPGMAHVWYAYPKKFHRDNPPTVLSTTLTGPEAHTPMADEWERINTAKSLAAGVPKALIYNGLDRVETYWEDLCEVRKIEEA